MKLKIALLPVSSRSLYCGIMGQPDSYMSAKVEMLFNGVDYILETTVAGEFNAITGTLNQILVAGDLFIANKVAQGWSLDAPIYGKYAIA